MHDLRRLLARLRAEERVWVVVEVFAAGGEGADDGRVVLSRFQAVAGAAARTALRAVMVWVLSGGLVLRDSERWRRR